MSEVYGNATNINRIAPKDRVVAFKKEVFILLHLGFSVQDLEDVIYQANEDEQYELSQAITESIKEFKGYL